MWCLPLPASVREASALQQWYESTDFGEVLLCQSGRAHHLILEPRVPQVASQQYGRVAINGQTFLNDYGAGRAQPYRPLICAVRFTAAVWAHHDAVLVFLHYDWRPCNVVWADCSLCHAPQVTNGRAAALSPRGAGVIKSKLLA